ncbi:MAG: hypothetical protein ACXW2P_00730 [Thermoanaerobaculia bacterium]
MASRWIARFCLIALVLVTGPVHAQRRRAVSPSDVPAPYRTLYSGLDAGLDKWLAYLDTRTPVAGHRITFGAEVITANTNRGSALLRPEALAGVRLFLDRLADMGVQGASISIGYPMLDPSFPRSDEYLAFYREVAREVRSRSMKLHVETGVVFANTPFSDLAVDFSQLTLARYVAGKRVMAERILEHMRPDFLGLGGEPDTEAGLTGLEELNDADVYANALREVVEGLDKGATVVGAGVGTWSPIQFAQRLVEVQELDAITLHIYPLWKMPIENATLIPALARAKGKRVTLDEAWLYKAVPAEAANIAANDAIFRRDAFDFWSPLDVKFLTTITRLAEVEGIDFVSPFWSTYFFGSIKWSSSLEQSPYSTVVERVNEAAVANLLAGRLTPLGEHYKQLIRTSGAATRTAARRSDAASPP